MAERRCPKCGSPAPDSEFVTLCPSCGAALKAETPPPSEAPPPEQPKPAPAAQDVVCASCGAANARGGERCWQCRRPLTAAPPGAGPAPAERVSLDLSRVFSGALATRRPDEDLDEALVRAAKAVSAEHWRDLFTIAVQMLGDAPSGENHEAAAARLAQEHLPVEISSSEETTGRALGEDLPPDARVVSSLDELPPHIRKIVEKRLGPLAADFTGARTTVTRRVVVRKGEVPPPSEVQQRAKTVSRKVITRSDSGGPEARGCVSFSTLIGLLVGILNLRR